MSGHLVVPGSLVLIAGLGLRILIADLTFLDDDASHHRSGRSWVLLAALLSLRMLAPQRRAGKGPATAMWSQNIGGREAEFKPLVVDKSGQPGCASNQDA
jgi:hypothetical protein